MKYYCILLSSLSQNSVLSKLVQLPSKNNFSGRCFSAIKLDWILQTLVSLYSAAAKLHSLIVKSPSDLVNLWQSFLSNPHSCYLFSLYAQRTLSFQGNSNHFQENLTFTLTVKKKRKHSFHKANKKAKRLFHTAGNLVQREHPSGGNTVCDDFSPLLISTASKNKLPHSGKSMLNASWRNSNMLLFFVLSVF